MTVNVNGARTFLRTHARIIEIRLAEFALDGTADAARGAIAGIEAYRNADGGFGNGLEPDALAPSSQPLAVDSAFDILSDIAESTTEPAIRDRAAATASATMDYLETVSGPDGGLPIVLPSVAEFPRAEHWGDGDFPPALNPTAKILGAARILGLDHPWMERATGFCRSAISGLPAGTDAHTALSAVRFLETEIDREQSRKQYQDLLRRSEQLALFKPLPGPGYGLTPLDFAPNPTDRRREFFATEAIDAHLDELASAQLEDGGWPLAWAPPGPGPTLAWRGVVTLTALRVLRANGRI